MPDELSDTDRRYLQRAIEISRRALEDDGKTPFGALVVVALLPGGPWLGGLLRDGGLLSGSHDFSYRSSGRQFVR